jgi:hypothetical protein
MTNVVNKTCEEAAEYLTPVIISHMTTPTEYMSTRRPCGLLCITSGAMYWGVPEIVLVPGTIDMVPNTFDSPKSATLTRP